MKTAEAKSHSSRSHTARPAEPFFQPEKKEAFFAEVQEGQTSPLQRKPAFASDGDEPPTLDMAQRQAAFASDGDEPQAPEAVQRKPAFEGEDTAVQTQPDPARARTPTNGVATPHPFFATSGDGGFFAKTATPFFTPSRIQAKLTIGPPDDRYEREADAMAERVVNRPDKLVAPPPPVQQQEDEEALQPSLFDSITPLLQRQEDEEAVQPKCAACEQEQRQQRESNGGEGAVQAKCAECEAKEREQQDASPNESDADVQTKPTLQRQTDESPTVGSDLESRLSSTKGGGQPLDETTQSQMEAGFGADFSGVRVHTGSDAARMNNELGAQAFTHGSDVYFNENKYQPNAPDGRRLLAHELTHTVQQGASVRKKPISRTGGERIQRGVIADLINKVLRNVPGYTLITVIIGKNPVTGDAVPRTATNVLDGLLGLLPGGAMLADKLKETGALQEAGAWISTEIDKLGITFSYIKELVSQAWDELSIWNSWGTNLGIVKRLFGAPYNRIKAFVGRIADKIKEFVFRGALKMVGAPVDKVMGILNKGADVIKTIIADPIGFFRNLARAVGGGIKRFVGNIKQHLISGLIDWLTGAMSEVPITLPAKFDLKGILDLVLQILGLTWDRIRAKLVKRLGEKVVAAVETGVDIVQRLIKEGPIALWEMIKEKAAEIKQQVMDGIRNWVITQIVKQAVIKLLSFVNPAGALVQAVLGLYNLVMFLIENFQRIVDLVNSVFTSIGEIARGAIGKASEFIEKTMARTVPIILNFLARLIGLSGIGKTVSGIITKIRKPIDKVVDKALDFIVKQAKKLFSRKKGKKEAAAEAKESPKSDSIKAQAGAELLSKIGKKVKDPKKAKKAIDEVYKKYRPKGLKLIDIVRDKKNPGLFSIALSASPTTIEVSGIDIEVENDEVGWRGLVKTLRTFSDQAYLYVTVTYNKGEETIVEKVNPFPIPSDSKTERHAEHIFIEDYFEAIATAARERKEQTGQKTDVKLIVNRLTCGTGSPSVTCGPKTCTNLIAETQAANKEWLQIHLNVVGEFRVGSSKKDDTTTAKRTRLHLLELLRAGVKVSATSFWREIMPTLCPVETWKKGWSTKRQGKMETMLATLIENAEKEVAAEKELEKN